MSPRILHQSGRGLAGARTGAHSDGMTAPAAAAAPSAPGVTTLVQLSDPHVVAPGRRFLDRIDTAALLGRAVAAVQRLEPPADAVVVTGDLVEAGAAAEYARVRALLAPLACPVYLLPGNHDAPAALRAACADQPWMAPPADAALAPHVLYAVPVGRLRLVALDTVVPGAPHGALCAARLAWLDRTLAAAPAAPTLVAMHHPPFATGIAHMDAMGLREGADGLAAVLRRHPQVERLLCGHLHRPIQARFGGTLALTAPGSAHQIALDLRPRSDCCLVMEPPGFLVHRLQGEIVVTHHAVVGDFGAPRPF